MFDKLIQFNVTFRSKRVKTEAANRGKARRSCVPAAALIMLAIFNVVAINIFAKHQRIQDPAIVPRRVTATAALSI